MKPLANFNQTEYSFSPRSTEGDKWSEVSRFFPLDLRQVLAKVPPDFQSKVIEIRLRLNQPLELNYAKGSTFITGTGDLVSQPAKALIIGPDQIKKMLQSITAGSVYALEEELIHGYLTLPGGHRVGFTGHALQNAGQIRLIRNISSINFRIAKAFK